MKPNPIEQFKEWYKVYQNLKPTEPSAVVLATATKAGVPSSRVVLLKACDEEGFVFFTNYESQKGQELISNPVAALTFYWSPIYQQVRVVGTVEKVTDEESDQYFFSRSYDSQLGAWASRQSQVLESREALEKDFDKFRKKYTEGQVPRPEYWGGFRVVPYQIEFWQGRDFRLHDRFRYTKGSKGWTIERLSP